MNAMAIYRITDRLEAFFEMDFASSQDTIRFELMRKIFDQFENCIFPQGLIGKATGEYGLYKDAPIIFLYHAFGSVVSIGIVLFSFIREENVR